MAGSFEKIVALTIIENLSFYRLTPALRIAFSPERSTKGKGTAY